MGQRNPIVLNREASAALRGALQLSPGAALALRQSAASKGDGSVPSGVPLGLTVEAVTKLRVQGVAPALACRMLGVTAMQLARWCVEHRVEYPGVPRTKVYGSSVTALQAEVDALPGASPVRPDVEDADALRRPGIGGQLPASSGPQPIQTYRAMVDEVRRLPPPSQTAGAHAAIATEQERAAAAGEIAAGAQQVHAADPPRQWAYGEGDAPSLDLPSVPLSVGLAEPADPWHADLRFGELVIPLEATPDGLKAGDPFVRGHLTELEGSLVLQALITGGKPVLFHVELPRRSEKAGA